MREYKPKNNVQKQAAYNDRFYVAPKVPTEEVSAYPEFVKVVEALKGIKLLDTHVMTKQLVIEVNPDDNYKTLQTLKDVCGYDMLMEMSANDFIEKDGEFEVFYLMLNVSNATRLRVKTRIKAGDAIESVVSLFMSADWAEREMFDMFGIVANNHPRLKRILLPDDWEGHPLLKTYPLQGDEFAQWYEVDKVFGKEYRDVIGPEIRDAGRIDRHDSKNFARIGHEVKYGADPEVEDLAQSNLTHDYDKNNLFVEKFKTTKILQKRR